jgi:uncharacterized protein with NAD-binding domain and iron-sulfur cluster
MTKTKIAILGGGVGALSAAFDLTEADPKGDLYDITIYQLGWRLGGKASVGWTCETYPTIGFEKRRVALEHGLHVWGGFYDNAFDLMKRLYAANDDLRGRSFLEAFTPVSHCWVMDNATGAYRPWFLSTRRNRRTPGLSRFPMSTGAVWRRLLRLTFTASLEHRLNAFLDEAHAAAPFALTQQELQFARKAHAIVDSGALESAGVWAGDRRRAHALVEFATTRLRAGYFRRGLAAHGLNEETFRIAIMINIGVALMLGMLQGRVLIDGFDGLDQYEWSTWMHGFGAWNVSLASGLVRGFYDYVFGFVPDNGGGAPGKKRNVAAGAATRALLWLVFGYKGAMFYRLDFTMGEFLIKPLYETLKQRGVKFAFFSRVDKLRLSDDKKTIDEIDIGVQAKLAVAEYEPLVDIPGNRRSWPARPNYEQLVDGAAMYAALEGKGQDLESPWNGWGAPDSKQLYRVKDGNGDFDKVILGIGLGALDSICDELAMASPRWDAMLREVGTSPTLTTQIWTNTTVDQYEWPPQKTIVTAFLAPLDTWGDNSQLLTQEAWSDGLDPKGLGYFVGNLFPVDKLPPVNAPSNFPVQELANASAAVAAWVTNDLAKLWPGFTPADLTIMPWVRVNVAPSDRYVQSLASSLESRLAPDGSGVDNLYLAGDWVRIAYNAGCIEQAVIGGRAAARAITGVDMNSQYDRDRNWDGEQPMSYSLTALLSNLPDLSKAAYAGVGSINACCIIAFPKTAVVKALLPPGLSFKLGTHEPDCLPLVLLFSEQKRVRPGFAPFGGINYLEVAMVVTQVYSDDPTDDYGGPYIYMPRLFLNSLGPTAIGASLYGFRKQMARIRRVGDSFQVRNSEGEISVNFENGSLIGQIRDFPQANLLRGFLDLPIISETPQGGFSWCYIDYHFDRASFQALSGDCDIHQGNFEADIDIKAVGPQLKGSEPGLVREALGVRLVTDWSITLPVRMGEYDGLLPKSSREHATAATSRLRGRLLGRR